MLGHYPYTSTYYNLSRKRDIRKQNSFQRKLHYFNTSTYYKLTTKNRKIFERKYFLRKCNLLWYNIRIENVSGDFIHKSQWFLVWLLNALNYIYYEACHNFWTCLGAVMPQCKCRLVLILTICLTFSNKTTSLTRYICMNQLYTN